MVVPDSTSKPPRAGLSLYANLIDPSAKASAPGTISRAPVVFKQTTDSSNQDDTSVQKQQLSAASLRFQPTKRPQIATQKPKVKPSVPKPVSPAINVNVPETAPPESTNATSRPTAKTTLADWTATADDDDVNGFYAGEKRQRGGRKKRKKNKEESQVLQNWDDIYEPSRPNSYEEYKHGDEKIREVREWKDRLYAHRMARKHTRDTESEDERRPRPQMSNQFAPPSMSFAPPSDLNAARTVVDSPPITPIPDDPTGEDAYTRRMRLSQPQTSSAPSSIVYAASLPPPPPPPLMVDVPLVPPPPQPVLDSKPPPTISRAPVRYNLPSAPSELPTTEAELATALEAESTEPAPSDEPRSLRPGQKGFAERLMSKYGWTKGSGLGASGSGITAPLRVQVEKAKRKSDAEGGGFVGPPGGRGKILGGKKKGGEEGGKFGVMSEVVVLRGMVDGMDLDREVGDGGLMQEIGEECGEKYGRVERVFIDRSREDGVPVFVKFTSQLSALRAVNALEDRIFNGNTITAKFFDTEKFEMGIYE